MNELELDPDDGMEKEDLGDSEESRYSSYNLNHGCYHQTVEK